MHNRALVTTILLAAVLLAATARAQAPSYLTQWGTEGAGSGQFDRPYGVAVDASGNVYVADMGNDRIQKFTSSGTYLTQWGSSGTGDGQFNCPSGAAVDGSGNVYVADQSNNRIQKFGRVTTPAKSMTWGRIKALYR